MTDSAPPVGSEVPAIPPPRANPILVGQERGERTLLEAWASGRLAHAWLITGARGIGKATLAFRFARFLLKSSGSGSEGGELSSAPVMPAPGAGLFLDPAHPVFRRVASGGHADLLTLERRVNDKTGRLAGEITVDEARRLPDFLSHTPAEDGWRVAIVDGAEDLNRNAANAILKSLEEPPRRTVLLLVSHAPGRLLATIRSRCSRLALAPLSAADVGALVRRYRPDLTGDQADVLAGLAGGSIGRALMLADEEGMALDRAIGAVFASLPALDVLALDGLGELVARAKGEDSFAIAADLFRARLARIITLAAGGRGERGDAAVPGERWLKRVAAGAGLDRWLEVWEKTDALLARAESANLDRKQVILTLFFALRRAAAP